MRSVLWLPLLLLAAAVPAAGDEPSADALSPCVRAAVDAVQQHYEAVEDLHARFEQTSRSVALGGPGSETRSSGEVIFAKPGRMRWSYTEPEPSLVVSDGEWLWIYDPTAREAQKLPVNGGAMSGAAVQFLLGDGRIERDFHVTADACSESEARLTLLPREPATYEKLRLVVDPRSGELKESEVVDLLGNVTRVAFHDVRTNAGTRPEQFEFEPPEGVETIELSPPPAP